MKKYAIILLTLVLIGSALSLRLLTQEQKLDQTVFLQTTKSIRHLQSLDQKFSLLLNQSRYNANFEHEQLGDTHYEISEEFDNLRFDALFEEIEASASLSQAVGQFETQFAARETTLEEYVASNSRISSSIGTINQVTEQIQQSDLDTQTNSIFSLLGAINASIYQLALGGELDTKLLNNESGDLLVQLAQLQSQASQSNSTALSSYLSAVKSITETDASNKQQLKTLNELRTASLLDAVEDEYTRYHNQAIGRSTQFRNALIIYGLCLLAALLFFGWQIRKNFLSLEQEIADRTAEIKSAYTELQESQEQLIQSEKMASLGQMVAGVAHEINTPLGYVTSNVDTLKLNLKDLGHVMAELELVSSAVRSKDRDNKKITQQLLETLKTYQRLETTSIVEESSQLLNDGLYGLNEISKLVGSLKDFARLERQNAEQVDINECIENSLTVASNHIRENQITIAKELTDLPKISCFPSKLNQLFLNVITNACQSMSGNGGELLVTSSKHGDQVVIIFKDQGIGMDQETQQKMFDPFFTTKAIGEGTGLGMSIAYKIIEAHKGDINVRSDLAQGTTIEISLPINPA
jgi:signal transduction histidine kinase